MDSLDFIINYHAFAIKFSLLILAGVLLYLIYFVIRYLIANRKHKR
ncbi:hypothetical protein [Brochothrix thermosphacta]|nr:hypothetical protein [Brochothrix thermosphacta]WKK68304.1 hypothetical protein Q0G00_08245 [Brochothrix thermosphacta]